MWQIFISKSKGLSLFLVAVTPTVSLVIKTNTPGKAIVEVISWLVTHYIPVLPETSVSSEVSRILAALFLSLTDANILLPSVFRCEYDPACPRRW